MSTNTLLEHRTDRLEEALIRLSEEMISFKNEMSEFKDEMRIGFENYKEENRNEQKKLNKQLGEISNKLGTVVEDIIYPAARPVISKYFNYDVDSIEISENIYKNKEGYKEEFDIIAVVPDKVFLIEVKSTIRITYIEEFKEKIKRFTKLFPEYIDKQLIPIIASLNINANTLNILTKNNIYAMAYREWEYMDLLNFKKLEKK
ncbi:MAG: hypothetical protein ACYCTB_04185 [bacterium]